MTRSWTRERESDWRVRIIIIWISTNSVPVSICILHTCMAYTSTARDILCLLENNTSTAKSNSIKIEMVKLKIYLHCGYSLCWFRRVMNLLLAFSREMESYKIASQRIVALPSKNHCIRQMHNRVICVFLEYIHNTKRHVKFYYQNKALILQYAKHSVPDISFRFIASIEDISLMIFLQ